jgi:hypothetical protein
MDTTTLPKHLGSNGTPATRAGEVVMVTPEIAAEWLTHNTHNRRIRRSAVDGYAMDMENGDWRWTGEPVRFAKDGRLLDGQHRLLAIVEADVTLPLLVISGLEPEAQEDIDAGVPRKFADVLELRGELNASSLAALVRKVHAWKRGRRQIDTGRSRAVTPAALSRTLEAHPELREIVTLAHTAQARIDLPPSLVGLAWWLFDGIDSDDAAFFFSRLADGQNLMAGNPIYELRKVIAANRSNTRGMRNDQRYLLALTIKAWNAYRNGDDVGVLRWRSGGAKPEAFPEPV